MRVKNGQIGMAVWAGRLAAALFCFAAAASVAAAQAPPAALKEHAIRLGADEELLMLTADENVVALAFEVSWRIYDPAALQSRLAEPDAVVAALAQSVLRDLIGAAAFNRLLTRDRALLQSEATRRLQQTLDEYGFGLHILRVTLDRVDPPRAVVDAFRSVKAAEQDGERIRREADLKAQGLPSEARDRAAALLEEAQAAAAALLADAEREAARIRALAQGYRDTPPEARPFYVEALRSRPDGP